MPDELWLRWVILETKKQPNTVLLKYSYSPAESISNLKSGIIFKTKIDHEIEIHQHLRLFTSPIALRPDSRFSGSTSNEPQPLLFVIGSSIKTSPILYRSQLNRNRSGTAPPPPIRKPQLLPRPFTDPFRCVLHRFDQSIDCHCIAPNWWNRCILSFSELDFKQPRTKRKFNKILSLVYLLF